MTRAQTLDAGEMSDSALRRTVEEILGEARGQRARISHLAREQSPFETLFPVEVLRITLDGGETLSLFLKCLGAEQVDHPDKQCRDREVRIYQELMTDPRLPVPRYYGSRWDAAAARHQLFLEYVDDWNLKYHGYEHWFPAARRLAQLHRHFAARARELLSRDFLLRFDAEYLTRWASRAMDVVTAQSTDLARQLEPIVQRYDLVADLIASQPVTLVHNDLAPKNVIADRSSDPARICFVDWEMAGVGCGVLDLVHLKYGMDAANDRTFCDAYLAELSGSGLLPADREELNRLLAACELHKDIYRLSHSQRWGVPLSDVAHWVRDAAARFESVTLVCS